MKDADFRSVEVGDLIFNTDCTQLTTIESALHLTAIDELDHLVRSLLQLSLMIDLHVD